MIHFLTLFSTVTSLIDIFIKKSVETSEEFFATTNEFGNDLGKIISSIYDLKDF